MAKAREVSLPELQALTRDIAEYYKIARTNADGSFHCGCPVHGGRDSLHISYSDRILFTCFGENNEACTQAALKERITTDGFDLNVICRSAESAKKKGSKVERKQNIPAHDQAPLDIKAIPDLPISGKDGNVTFYPVTRGWTYTDSRGQIIFHMLRADTNVKNDKGKYIKHMRPWQSVRDEKGDSWVLGLSMATGRPLYNLKELIDNPTKPVLVVEGEKTCDAAKLLFRDYVCVTYSFGMTAYDKTDFKVLKDRNVTLWPDNSKGGIDNFLKVASIISPIPKIVMEEPLSGFPDNWDLADDPPADAPELRAILADAQIANVLGVSPETAEEALAKYNQFLRCLWIRGSTYAYDISKKTDDPWLPFSFCSFADLPKHYPEMIANPFPTRNLIRIPAVKLWEQSSNKITTYDITYDPETTDEIIIKRGIKYTNKFRGFDHPPKACDPAKYACFEKHIRNIMGPVEAEYLMCFFADIVQHPKSKPGVLPMLIGKTATGKTIVGDIMAKMLGRDNVAVKDGRTFNSKWTGQFSGKLLIVANEYTTENYSTDYMNTFITDTTISLEHKGMPIYSEESYHRVMATTNEENFKISSDDRRYFPIKIHNPNIDSIYKPASNREYFKDLDRLKYGDEEALCGLHYYLKQYKITVDVKVVPQTVYRREGMQSSNPVDNIVLGICEDGSFPEEFGIVYSEQQIAPYTKQYPHKVLRKHLRAMVKTMTKMDGPKVTHFLMRFFRPEHFSEHSNITMRFNRRGKADPTSVEEDNGKIFEIPPLEELRKRYNEQVDPAKTWAPVLRVVKDDEDDSPI